MFILLHELEHSALTKHGGNFSNSVYGEERDNEGLSVHMPFRTKFLKAQRHYDLAKAYLFHSYVLLSKDRTDLEKVMMFMDRAVDNERIAREEIDDLLHDVCIFHILLMC
jgi:hypothetical protein